jgi:hypothetical protein
MDAANTQNSTATYLKTQQNQNVGTGKVIGAIQAASARTGVDFAYLLHKADQESSLNPNAQASTSSASGLFQFIKSTWLKMVKDHGAEYGMANEAKAITEKNGHLSVDDPVMREKILNMRHDPVLSSAMAAEFTKQNKDYLDASVGGNIGSTELYMAHFLGAGGATTFLKAMKAAPNASAAEFMPEAANANRSVFYGKSGKALSLSDIYNRFAAKFDKPLNAFSVAGVQDVATPLMPRDFASMSSAFYHVPVDDGFVSLSNNQNNQNNQNNHQNQNITVDIDMLREVTQFNNSTAGTLFNTMLLAQTNMKDFLTHVGHMQELRV